MKKKMSFIKRMMITIVVLAIGSLTSFLYIYHNFSTYFIYYAKHIPHEKGANPEMVFILDYLDYLGESSIKGLRYDTDGHNSIIKDSSYVLMQTYDNDNMSYGVGFLKEYNIENYRFYYFTKSGKFYRYSYQKSDTRKDIYDKSAVRQKEAQSYVDEVINPIVEKMETKPSVNLQWLFNKIYQKRFE